MNTTEITKRIQEHIEHGRDKFIIYPFGYNGIIIKNMLKEYFNLEPYMVVDNLICKINPNIISGEELQEKYRDRDDMTVILTVENRETNIQILSQLDKFVDLEDVINVLGPIHRYLPQFILPPPPHRGGKGKIKVRILIRVRGFWQVISSLCAAITADVDIDFLLLDSTFIKQNDLTEAMQQYNYIAVEDYNPQEDLPDILITTWFFDDISKKIQFFSKKVIVLSYWSWYELNKNFGLDMAAKLYEITKPDYVITDSFNAISFKENLPYLQDKIVEIDSPKLDGMYESINNKNMPSEWSKIKGKKIILWCLTHGVTDNNFGIYARKIFDYTQQNSDIALIVRFHPWFEDELINNKFWTKDTINIFKEYFHKSTNIVLDTNTTYGEALAVCDAVVTDSKGFTAKTVLPSLKPICVIHSLNEEVKKKTYIDTLYYHVNNEEGFIAFFEMVKNNVDSLFEKRKEFVNKYIKYFDGKNGERIKEFIKGI